VVAVIAAPTRQKDEPGRITVARLDWSEEASTEGWGS